MKSLFLNDAVGNTHDIVFEDGVLQTVSDEDYIKQKVKTLLLSIEGDFFLNTNIGLPYFDVFFVKNPDLDVIKQAVSDEVLNNDVLIKLGVTNLQFRRVNIDERKRKLSVDILIYTENSSYGVNI